jgi:hypothetical protein
MISGVVMVSIAPLALLGALAAKNSQDSCDDQLEQDYPDHVVPSSQKYRVERCDSYSAPIYVLGIGGAVLAAAGVPLIIYGAKTVPARRADVELAPWATSSAGGLKLRVTM